MSLINFQNEQVDTTGQANGQGGSVVQRYTQTPTPTATVPAPTVPAPASGADSGLGTPLLTADQFSAQRDGSVDEQGIRDSVAQQMQGQIDATNNYYADLLNTQKVADQNNTGKTRATDARSGLLGSDFGNAHAANQETANENADKSITDEQSTKIAAIEGNIDTIANQEIAAKRAQATGDADAYSKYISDAQTQAKSTLQQLATAGTDLSTLDPQKKAYLYQAAGLDPAVGDLVYNSMKPAAAQLNYKYITQADGSTLAIAPDPKNPGQFIESTIPGTSPDVSTVISLMGKYPDAGITSKDDLTSAAQKIKQNSKIYAKDTYIAPPSSSSSGAGGASDALLQAINNGSIDPNRVNSRTIGLYNDIAQAQVDAVSSHAGSNAKTNAYNDTYAIKTSATRLLTTIDKNLPLVASLADKVNTSGIPGLNDYINGAKTYTGNDPDLGKYINSLTTLRTEYANMLAKGATPTESQRSEAEQAIPSGKDGAFYSALGDQLKLEGNNIISSADDTLSNIFSQGSGSSSGNSTDSDPLGVLTP